MKISKNQTWTVLYVHYFFEALKNAENQMNAHLDNFVEIFNIW